ncbi:hypothetical protein HAX54_047368 [Datura stramonium]|uniref:F-box domain-containing protein n=1 Tax=Datura stramonium TaxID=4076 RepID=A0ABS8SSU0_DATST|nr:hypothetical protein [Datura stramonium]
MEGKSDIDAAADNRISKLPEPILQHILSYLHAEDAARMSTLSKKAPSKYNSLTGAIFAAKALNVLNLDGFKIEMPCDDAGIIKFSSLRELHLCDVIVISKDLRENLLPPLYGTNVLQVNLQKRSNYSVVDVIDSMLWISPQLDTLIFTQAPRLKT